MESRYAALAIPIAALLCTPFAQAMGKKQKVPESSFGYVLQGEQASSAAEARALEAFLSKTLEKLPPALRTALKPVSVRFVDPPDNSTSLHPPVCVGDPKPEDRQWLGELTGHREIRLNSLLKDEILKGPEDAGKFPCRHGNFHRLAMATLLHETAHLYDLRNLKSETAKEDQRYCIDLQQKEWRELPGRLVEWCQGVLASKMSVSDTPAYLNLMGWSKPGLTGKSRPRNNLVARSPDPYEFKDVHENFAVNFEHFLLDPEFACRRPTVHGFFKDHFGYVPFNAAPCQPNTSVNFSPNAFGQSGNSVNLDPSRVYQIHYLFAAKGPKLMSRWGHAMYRVILCNPTRKTVGPECLADIRDHVVISYRANPGGWIIDPWKGLSGDYPSQMYLHPFYPAIVNEYILDEFRDLVSVPLLLTNEEKTRFIHRVLEQNWEYSGSYYFFTNNCATEALNFLKGILERKDFQSWSVFSPIGLFRDLENLGIADTKVLADRAAAVEGGFLFPSKRKDYEDTFKVIGALSDGFTYSSLNDYVTKSAANERLSLYENAVRLGREPEAKIAGRFFIMEAYIFRRARSAFAEKVWARAEVWLNHSGDRSSDIEAKIDRLHEIRDKGIEAVSNIKGYGIALSTDFPAPSGNSPETDETNKILSEVFEAASGVFKEEAKELEALSRNRKLFLANATKKP